MELRVLQYFLMIAREGTISDAASALHVSQPTLSRQIMELERELGTTLFTRGGGRRIELTDAGNRLRKRAEEIVDLVGRTESEFRVLGNAVEGEVRIGGGETPAIDLIARVIEEIRLEHPGIRFQLFSGNAEDVTERLDTGRLDFGLFVGEADLGKYDEAPLAAVDTWGVFMRPDDPLAHLDAVGPRDLREKPLILSRQAVGEMEAWLGREASRLNIAATFNLLYNACALVRAGVGYAISIDGIVRAEGVADGLLFKPLAPEKTARLTLAWKRHQAFSPAARVFLERVRKMDNSFAGAEEGH
ncbi:LysR family transcriptional regulator [Raoultibacter phocaeensis]|uniref:LysR family transcriptional regulator n=1 Tax=Raoultibacter phocaeensis TaxID=2479841 RepID=UPI001119068B|nr:LysR family transcriptional regulator [Raoultibacter phocaeensis]